MDYYTKLTMPIKLFKRLNIRKHHTNNATKRNIQFWSAHILHRIIIHNNIITNKLNQSIMRL